MTAVPKRELKMQPEDLCRDVLAFAAGHEPTVEPIPTGIAGLTAMVQTAPTMLVPTVYNPVFCLVLQGAKQVQFEGRAMTFARMESLIVGLDVLTAARVIRAGRAEPYVALALRLGTGLLHELAEAVGEDELRAEQASAVATGEADQAVLDAMARLFALHAKPTAARVLEPLIVKEIHYLLLAARHGAMLRKLTRADSHASRIARAIAVIRRDFNAPLRTADLARVAGMSVSAFHEHFRAVTATTPLQFQKQLRLMEARRLLMGGGNSVSATAFEVGYESPTQFSREYSRMFGAPPSRTQAEPLRA